MSLRLDSFKGALPGGGARPNLFRVTVNFPSAASSAIAGLAAAAFGGGIGDAIGAGANLGNAQNGAGAKLKFLAKAATLPASTIGVIDLAFRGQILKVHGDRTFEPWTITVINDTDFAIRDAFEQWSNDIVAHESNTGPGGLSSFIQDAFVEQLGRDGGADNPRVLKTYRFVGTWPTVIGAIDLDFETTNQIETFTVELAVQRWESSTTG